MATEDGAGNAEGEADGCEDDSSTATAEGLTLGVASAGLRIVGGTGAGVARASSAVHAPTRIPKPTARTSHPAGCMDPS
ncbi:MAG: hypothetical protein QOF51_4262 [Chloroflexota bacterium]|nr:hypothetical protein [Chloroflexota bacterium]